jgi:DNA-binding MarR family transcriptional regulator
MTYGRERGAARASSPADELTEDNQPQARGMPIGVLLHDVARMRRQMFDAETKPLGLTRSQCWVLAHLGRDYNRGRTQSEIADALGVGKVTLGGLVDRLEARGLVRRELSAADRRVKYVLLTAKGRRAVARTRVIRPLVDEFIMRGISPRLREELAGALLLMRSNLLAVRRRRSSDGANSQQRLHSDT